MYVKISSGKVLFAQGSFYPYERAELKKISELPWLDDKVVVAVELIDVSVKELATV